MNDSTAANGGRSVAGPIRRRDGVIACTIAVLALTAAHHLALVGIRAVSAEHPARIASESMIRSYQMSVAKMPWHGFVPTRGLAAVDAVWAAAIAGVAAIALKTVGVF